MAEVRDELHELVLQPRAASVVTLCLSLKRCDSPACIRIFCLVQSRRTSELGKLCCKFFEIELFSQWLRVCEMCAHVLDSLYFSNKMDLLIACPT
jgi:hypothetical protein